MRKIEATVPARAAATDGEQTIGETPYGGTISSVSYIPEAAIVGADVNTRRLSLVNRGQAGAGATEVAALAFAAGVNAAQNDEIQFTLSGTPANLKTGAGDVLELFSDSQGTGLADPGGLIQVEIVPN